MKIHLYGLNKWKKRGIALLSDVIVTLIAWLAAGALTGKFVLIENISVALIITLQAAIYIFCGLYRGVWRFASIPDLIRITRAIFFGAIINNLFLFTFNEFIPVPTYIIFMLLLTVMLAGTRFVYRWLNDYQHFISYGKRVLVVGAGYAGEGLIRDLYRSPMIYHYLPVAFVDDDPLRLGCDVHGVRVMGQCKDIAKLVKQLNIELILIAIPSASSTRMRRIVRYCEEANVPFRTLPGIKNIADGSVKISELREVLLEDLLGREEVDHDWNSISSSIKNKTILVTGGGGSIGGELCRQIANLHPDNLIIVDNNEFNLYAIDMELRKKNIDVTLHIHLASVTDRMEMEKIFAIYKPNIVFHVAAYKHVPLLENHVRIAMHNNIIGTKITAELSDAYQVKAFVLISTDKAVNPTSIMGATKRAAEVFCQTFNMTSSTQFVTVRFGNVLDSAGSVIPLFRQQLQKGGPLTVTHPEITRYFMTIPEAAQLILQATTMHEQGEIFVLDMGEPINIRYLAEQMIKLSGKIVDQDIEIKYTGLRAGEKLYEELFHANENIGPTSHPKINQAKVRHFDRTTLNNIIERIELAYHENDEKQLLDLLIALVPEYQGLQHSKKEMSLPIN